MRPNLPNQAEIRAANGGSGRIRFHLMYAAGDLQQDATKMSVDRGLLAKLGPPTAGYQRPLLRSHAVTPIYIV
jgi:hypothetical protein